MDEIGAGLLDRLKKGGHIITRSVEARAKGDQRADSYKGKSRGRSTKRSANNPKSGNTSGGNTSASEDQPAKRPRTHSTGRPVGSSSNQGKGQKKDQKKFVSKKTEKGKAYADAADPTGAHRKEAVVTHKSPLTPPTGAPEPTYHDTRSRRHKAERDKQIALFKKIMASSSSASGQTETLQAFALTPTQAKLDQRPLDLPGGATEHQPHKIETVKVQVDPLPGGALPPEGDGHVKPKQPKPDPPKKPKKVKKEKKDKKEPAEKAPQEEIPMETDQPGPEPLNLGQDLDKWEKEQLKLLEKGPAKEAIGAAAGGAKQAHKQQKQKERKDPATTTSITTNIPCINR